MTILQAILLGVIQGLTEFLPISSSGHLAITQKLLGLKVLPAFDVLLHFASVTAILLTLWSDAWSVLTTRRRLILPLIVATIPAGVAGLFFAKYFESAKESMLIVGIGLMVTGIVLALSDRLGRKQRTVASISITDAALIGVAQAIALPPGVSRSGMTISGGLFRGLSREDCVRFSFLMAIPVIGGAAVLELPKLFKAADSPGAFVLAAGFVASVISSALAIKLLLGLVRRISLRVFSFYVVPLGMLLFLADAPILFAGWLQKFLQFSATAADVTGYALIALILTAVGRVTFFGLRKRENSSGVSAPD
ncbi:MAG TPA: undecaprenyl-diphosphate phosphatase [Planctomycetota bacterium]|nr:undecaprenyl-diphosphate phosphatase [Planctomycetota bacterium]